MTVTPGRQASPLEEELGFICCMSCLQLGALADGAESEEWFVTPQASSSPSPSDIELSVWCVFLTISMAGNFSVQHFD